MFSKIKKKISDLLTGAYVVSPPSSGQGLITSLFFFYIIRRYYEADNAPRFSWGRYPFFRYTLLIPFPFIKFTHDVSARQVEAENIKDVFDPSPYRKKPTVLFVRDPREALLSNYHARRRNVERGAWSRVHDNLPSDVTLSHYMRDPQVGLVRRIDFLNCWAPLIKNQNNIALFTYEAMRRNTFDEIKRMLEFIGIKNSDSEALWWAVEHSSFDKMRAAERIVSNSEKLKTRAGSINTYKDEFNEEDLYFTNNLMNKLDSVFKK